MWYEVVGSGDEKHLLAGTRVEFVRHRSGIMAYTSKYFMKPCALAEWDYVGRYWGVFKRDQLPWSSLEYIEITQMQANDLIRYMRKYAGIRGKDFPSLSIYVNDPEQWKRLIDNKTESRLEWVQTLAERKKKNVALNARRRADAEKTDK